MLVPPVHIVSDRRLAPDLARAARSALAGLPPGSVAFHLREKDLGGRDLVALARALRALCTETGQLLVVNDRVDVALAAGADGVHLPSAGLPVADARALLGPDRLVGVSCHAAEDVRRAREIRRQAAVADDVDRGNEHLVNCSCAAWLERRASRASRPNPRRMAWTPSCAT